MDQMLIGAVLPAQELGFYVVAVGWSRLPNFIYNAFSSVLFPYVAAQSDSERSTSVFSMGCRVGILLAFVLSLCQGAITPWGLPLLFGGDFSAAVSPAILLVFAGNVSGMISILEEGGKRAKKVADKTLSEVKDKIGINYRR